MGYYLPKLVALCGRKGSGKDTAAQILVEELGYKAVKFAGPLKDMIRSLLSSQNVNSFMIERMIEGDLKEVPTGYLGGRSPRYAMQTLGTEWGRDLIHTNFWTDAFCNQLNLEDNSRYVCTDMRFPNESQLIYELGGLRYRIERRTELNNFSDHPSEKMIDDLVVNTVIHNIGTVKELQKLFKSYVVNDGGMTKLYDPSKPHTRYVVVN